MPLAEFQEAEPLGRVQGETSLLFQFTRDAPGNQSRSNPPLTFNRSAVM
jgi:hypothetical protein